MNNLASAVGDLVSRDKRLTFAEVDQIFDIAPAAMYPYGSTGLSIRVSAVQIDKDKNATVAWSRAKGSKAAYTAGTSVNNFIAANLRVPESQIIMSEVYQSYRPGVGYVITGEINMEDRMFFVPRLDRVVKLCDNKGENCKPDRY
jgi:Flp pilus assembly protein TadG